MKEVRKETGTKSRSLRRLRMEGTGEIDKWRGGKKRQGCMKSMRGAGREKEALGKAWEFGAVFAEGKSKTE